MKNVSKIVLIGCAISLCILSVGKNYSPDEKVRLTTTGSGGGVRSVGLEEGSASYGPRQASQSGSFTEKEYADYSSADREKAIKRAKLFQRSRSGNDAELRSELKKSFAEGLISSNEYYGELAHMLSVSGNENIDVFSEIVDSNNPYGIEVMYSSLAANPGWVRDLEASDRTRIFNKLMEIKPVFSGHVSELGMAEVYRYENWMKSLENVYPGRDFETFVYEKIVANAPEPRDFIALKYSGYLKRLRDGSKNFDLTRVDKVLADYKNFYSDNDAANIILN